jgi:hypothetical protein
MDALACLDLLGCSETPGLQIHKNLLLKVFLNGKGKCYIKHFYSPTILSVIEKKYQTWTENKGV